MLKENNIPSEKIFFIDTLTSEVQTPPKLDNCIFVQSPSALTEISLAFSDALSSKGCDVILIDSISTLLIYQDVHSIIRFSQTLMTKGRVMNKKLVFVALKEDSEGLVKDISMFVDKIIDYTKP